MSTVQESIEVEVPVTTAYNQWTQFESFPEFMEGVDHVDQITDTLTHWRTSIGGVKREFDAEIIEQKPDQSVAWRSVDPPRQAGAVTFEPVSPDRTLVTVLMDFEPSDAVEQAGDKLGVVRRRVHGDLERFKKFIEERGRETGGWRGEVDPGAPAPGTTTPGTATPGTAGGTWSGSTPPPEDAGRTPL